MAQRFGVFQHIQDAWPRKEGQVVTRIHQEEEEEEEEEEEGQVYSSSMEPWCRFRTTSRWLSPPLTAWGENKTTHNKNHTPERMRW